MEPIEIPHPLREIHEHISETFKSADAHLDKFNEMRATQESTATHIVATHEPLYKAKQLLVQLVKDLSADDTQTTLSSSDLAGTPYAIAVSHAFLHACTLLSSIMLKASETAEAYRWCIEALRLIDKMHAGSSCWLAKEDFKSIDPVKIAKYQPAPVPHFFETPTPGAAASAMAMDLLLLACQVWATWSDPDNVRLVAEAAERLARKLPLLVNNNTSPSSPSSSPTPFTPTSSAPAASSGVSLDTIMAARAGSTEARLDVAKAELTEAQAARAFQENREQSRQQSAAKVKLLQRRAAKAGQTLAAFAVPLWLLPFTQPNFFPERSDEHLVATCAALWSKGEIENRSFINARQLDTITCVVQAYKGSGNNPVSSFYSHRALEFRLPEAVASAAAATASKKARAAAGVSAATEKDEAEADEAKQQQLDEWIGLCLSLAEYYFEERDLSHCMHCLDVSEALMMHRGAQAGATSSISTYKGYKTSNGVMLRLLRLRLVAFLLKLFVDALEQQAQIDDASAAAAATSGALAFKDSTSVTVQLFQNPLLLPEEFASMNAAAGNSASSGTIVLPPSWKSRFVDTSARLNLLDKCDDPSLEAMVPRPATSVTVTGRSVRELAAARLADYSDSLIPQLLSALDVDDDCERFIHSRRAVAEFYGIVFRISHNPVVGERRLKVLSELRSSSLHETVFRNVLRQAEFDYATQSLGLAELLPKESRRAYYEQAETALAKFCGAFERELALVKKENVPVTLEGGDFLACGLGSMRRIETLLKLEKLDEVGKTAAALIEFATTFQAEGGAQLAEMKTLATELHAVLNGGGTAAAVSQVAKKVEASSKKHTVTSSTKRHVDPKRK